MFTREGASKILLSAYACEPNRGSEPGVGWHWAVELARLGHKVWVLTRANNRSVIEAEFSQGAQPANLFFLYYDLPTWTRRWKKGGRGVHLYYLLWQWGAYLLAQKRHKEIQFDLVHHITFVSIRQPSFMGNLDIPFIFGPVAGGERAPWRLRFGYGPRGFMLDALRDVANLLIKFDPLMCRTFKQATKIYVTSEQTCTLIPCKYRHKASVQMAIGVDEKLTNSPLQLPIAVPVSEEKILRILYVGQFLYLKGMHLGLPAFAKLLENGVSARLTLVGNGPDEKRWRKLAEKLGVSNLVDWIPWVSQLQLSTIYNQHDVFLFPSLHDSGGMVVLEAITHGLPVICLKLGGPGQIVDDSCGVAIPVISDSRRSIAEKIKGALKTLNDEIKHAKLSVGARKRAQKLTWASRVASIYLKSGET